MESSYWRVKWGVTLVESVGTVVLKLMAADRF